MLLVFIATILACPIFLASVAYIRLVWYVRHITSIYCKHRSLFDQYWDDECCIGTTLRISLEIWKWDYEPEMLSQLNEAKKRKNDI